eukprot:2111867-Pleurochrysis_carterae.AAC.1
MHAALKSCHPPTALNRYILSHMPPRGERLPRACLAPGCTFGHKPSLAADAEMAEMLPTEAELKANSTKAGKSRCSRWRMAHAATHANVQPGSHGQPMLDSDMNQHMDPRLHPPGLARSSQDPFKIWHFEQRVRRSLSSHHRAACKVEAFTRLPPEGQQSCAREQVVHRRG